MYLQENRWVRKIKKDQSCLKAPDITSFCGTHAGAQKEVDLVRGRGGVTIAFWWGWKHYYSQIFQRVERLKQDKVI